MARLVVITGGPGSGKTTVVEALAARGHATVSEAAMQIIAEHNARLGVEGQREWRRANLRAFQELVLARQIQLEDEALRDASGLVFLDRSRVDGLAYLRHFDERPPPALLDAIAARRYDAVFLLDTLTRFEDRSASGRTSDRRGSLALRDRLDAVYRECGYAPLHVPEGSVEERVARILAAC